MVSKKPGTRKKSKKKSRKDASLKTHLKRTMAGLSLLLILVVIAGFLAHHFIQPKQPISSIEKIPVAKKTVQKVPAFEIYPQKDILPRKPILKPKIVLPIVISSVRKVYRQMTRQGPGERSRVVGLLSRR